MAAPVIAQTTDIATAPKPPKKICRQYQITGSILGGHRECHTAAEWSAIDSANSDNVRSAMDRSNGGGGLDRGRN